MKFIITENKRNQIVIDWLDKNYGDLEKVIDHNPIYITYVGKGGNILLYNRNRGLLTILNKDLQSQLMSVFGLDNHSINDIFIPWMEQRYNEEVELVKYKEFYCDVCGKFHNVNYHIE